MRLKPFIGDILLALGAAAPQLKLKPPNKVLPINAAKTIINTNMPIGKIKASETSPHTANILVVSYVSFRFKLSMRPIILYKPLPISGPYINNEIAEKIRTNMVPSSLERAIWPFFFDSSIFFDVGSSVFSCPESSDIRLSYGEQPTKVHINSIILSH